MDYKTDKYSLIFGDCLKRLKEIPSNSIDLIIADPPYDIKNTTPGGNSKLANSMRPTNDQIKNKNLTKGYDLSILHELIRVCKGINIYIFCNKAQLPLYFNYFVNGYNTNFDLIKWVKTNPVPTFFNKYISDTEYCFYARKKGYCNPQSYEDGLTLYSDKLNTIDKNKYMHPTVKPLPLIEKLVRNSSKKGDIILDPFMGTGTTGVACLNHERKFIGMENDLDYFAMSCARMLDSEYK